MSWMENVGRPLCPTVDEAVESMVEAWAIRRFGMETCLRRVMSQFEPNRWGLT